MDNTNFVLRFWTKSPGRLRLLNYEHLCSGDILPSICQQLASAYEEFQKRLSDQIDDQLQQQVNSVVLRAYGEEELRQLSFSLHKTKFWKLLRQSVLLDGVTKIIEVLTADWWDTLRHELVTFAQDAPGDAILIRKSFPGREIRCEVPVGCVSIGTGLLALEIDEEQTFRVRVPLPETLSVGIRLKINACGR